MKKTTWTTSGLSLALIAILSGCSGDATTTISGKAIDPYLQDAYVCLDTNDNGECDANDIRTTTDQNGTYTLTVSETVRDEHHDIIITGGTDSATDHSFNGVIVAVDPGEGNVTVSPLTTLAAERYHAAEGDASDDLEQAIEDVATYLDLNVSDITADIVARAEANDTRPLQVALALEAAAEVEAGNDANTTEAKLRFYHDLARNDYETGRKWYEDVNTTVYNTVVKPILDYNGTDTSTWSAGFTMGDTQDGEHGYTYGNFVINLAGLKESVVGEHNGNDAANAGADAGQEAGDTGAQAGNDAANTGDDAGESAGDAGSDSAEDTVTPR
jgi:hypothetical protein